MWQSLIIAFVVAVAICDIAWRQIPRYLTATAFVVGLIFHAVFGGIGSALLASAVAAIMGVAFFRIGAIGGGDLKLLICLGAILGLADWLVAMNVAVLFAALMGLVQIVRRRLLMQTLKNIVELVRGFWKQGMRPDDRIHVRNPLAVRAPFGVAAAVGTIFAVVVR